MYKLQVIKTEKPIKPPKPPKVKRVRKPWSRKQKILVIAGALVLLVGGAFFWVQKTLTGPAVGTIISSVPETKSGKEVELEQFDGKLLSFVHPITFVEQTQKQQPVSLETHTFVSSEMVSHVLVATITSLPSKNPEDDPSYKMRTLDKVKYHMKQTVVKNEKVTIFTTDDAQQMQQAAFWVHDDKLLTFVLSGATGDTQTITKQFNDMINSIVWR